MPRTTGGLNLTEIKYFDTELTATAITASANWPGTEVDPDVVPVTNIDTLFAPIEGSGINNRVGRQVAVKGIRIRGNIIANNKAGVSVADVPSYVRLIMFQDKQTNGAQAQGEEVMSDPVTNNTFMPQTSLLNLANLGRFRILKDKIFTLQNAAMTNDTGATGGVVMQGLIRTFKWNVMFRDPIIVNFNATNGGTIADVVDNSFHLLAVTGTTAGVPTISYSCRISYLDR